MALPSSGALSLNAIHVEAGGSSGTLASINDSDIRGLISKSSGAQMSFNEWYGASSNLYDGTVTNGYTDVDFGFAGHYYFRGFKNGNSQQGLYTLINNVNFGSVSDGTVDFLSGASLIVLAEAVQGSAGAAVGTLNFEVSGSFSNSGFSTLKLTTNAGSNTFNRTDATYQSQNGTTSWAWTTTVNQSPFGTNGANVTSTTFEFN